MCVYKVKKKKKTSDEEHVYLLINYYMEHNSIYYIRMPSTYEKEQVDREQPGNI